MEDLNMSRSKEPDLVYRGGKLVAVIPGLLT